MCLGDEAVDAYLAERKSSGAKPYFMDLHDMVNDEINAKYPSSDKGKSEGYGFYPPTLEAAGIPMNGSIWNRSPSLPPGMPEGLRQVGSTENPGDLRDAYLKDVMQLASRLDGKYDANGAYVSAGPVYDDYANKSQYYRDLEVYTLKQAKLVSNLLDIPLEDAKALLKEWDSRYASAPETERRAAIDAKGVSGYGGGGGGGYSSYSSARKYYSRRRYSSGGRSSSYYGGGGGGGGGGSPYTGSTYPAEAYAREMDKGLWMSAANGSRPWVGPAMNWANAGRNLAPAKTAVLEAT